MLWSLQSGILHMSVMSMVHWYEMPLVHHRHPLRSRGKLSPYCTDYKCCPPRLSGHYIVDPGLSTCRLSPDQQAMSDMLEIDRVPHRHGLDW